MRKYKLPFRVGHHFASNVVEYARDKDIRPLDFPYAQAERIYAETVKDSGPPQALPMSKAEFRSRSTPWRSSVTAKPSGDRNRPRCNAC